MSNEHHKKQFEGWWIPEFIVSAFEAKTINATELIVLREIDSLSNCTKGCFAGNKYIGKMAHVGIGQIGIIISRLKQIGLVKQRKGRGTSRWLKSCPPNFEEQEQGSSNTERPDEPQDPQFAGWWIPKEIVEIYKDDKINTKELLLLATINNLSKAEGGCYATNTYLGKQLHISDDRIRQCLVHLKELGLVIWVKGCKEKKRILKTSFLDIDYKPKKTPGQTLENVVHIRQLKDKTKSLNSKLDTKVSNGEKISPFVKKEVFNSSNEKNTNTPKIRKKTKKPNVQNIKPLNSKTLFSHPSDRINAAEYRSVLMEHDSSVLEPRRDFKGNLISRPVNLIQLVHLICRLRTEKKVSVDDIEKMLVWLRQHLNDPYCPKIRTHTDLYNKWEAFIHTRVRIQNGNSQKSKTDRMMGFAKSILLEKEMELV